MFRISKDSPVHYLTSVTHDRLSVFQTAKLKELVCGALNEARILAEADSHKRTTSAPIFTMGPSPELKTSDD